MKRLKIGCDIDDVLAEFLNPYLKRFGPPKKDGEITKNVARVLIKDRNFWLNLPVLNNLDFIPELYCTKRVNNKKWTKQWLKSNGFPDKPVYQVYCQIRNKADFVKNKIDIFIDDSISNFIAMNLAGVPCLLYDREHNREWGSVGRIYSLNYSDIEKAYYEFMEIFPNFKSFVI